MQVFGLPDDAFNENDEDDEQDEVMDIWPENWDAVTTFVACGTQWRTAGMTGHPTGLDYAAVEAVMRIRIIDNPRDCFDRIRIMESAALKAMAERRGQSG